jgi:CheY-like chemotaxis protein
LDGGKPSPHRVDLILMDIVMPSMNGIEACRQIKVLGISEARERRRGVWSEVGRGMEERLAIGKARSRRTLVKTLSSLARIGKV